MIKLKFFFPIVTFFLFFSPASFAANKIAYLDIDFILLESIPSKSLLSKLKKIEASKIKKFKNEETKLKEEEEKIFGTKNIISKEEYNKSVIKFKNKVEKYQINKNKDIQNLNERRNDEILRFLKLINPIIEKVMNENSIEILIEKKNIFIAKSNYDITKIIIENINNNIKDFLIED